MSRVSILIAVSLAAMASMANAQGVAFGVSPGPNEGEVTLLLVSFDEQIAGIQFELSGPAIFSASATNFLSGFLVVANGNSFISFSLSGAILPTLNGEVALVATLDFINPVVGVDEVCVLDSSVYAISGSTQDFTPALIPGFECAIIPGPPLPPSPPSPPPAAVLSDPHLHGLRGQEFDFTGEPSKIYSLISDQSLEVNALFGTAWSSSVLVDPDTLVADQMQPKGTWMQEIGVVAGANQVLVSVVSSMQDFMCPRSSEGSRDVSCFFGGSVSVNGEPQARVGEVAVDSSMSVTLTNLKSYGRVAIVSDNISVNIDYVPPPSKWNVPADSVEDYAHLNLHIVSLALSNNADGVLGQTSRLNLDSDGNPITKSSSPNGSGILTNDPEDFEVSSIFATDAKINQFAL